MKRRPVRERLAFTLATDMEDKGGSPTLGSLETDIDANDTSDKKKASPSKNLSEGI